MRWRVPARPAALGRRFLSQQLPAWHACGALVFRTGPCTPCHVGQGPHPPGGLQWHLVRTGGQHPARISRPSWEALKQVHGPQGGTQSQSGPRAEGEVPAECVASLDVHLFLSGREWREKARRVAGVSTPTHSSSLTHLVLVPADPAALSQRSFETFGGHLQLTSVDTSGSQRNSRNLGCWRRCSCAS